MNPELAQEIANLRALNLTPKQIARKLGLRASDVTSIIQVQAKQSALVLNKKGELAPIAKCLANKTCIRQLLQPESRGWFSRNKNNDDLDFGGGFGGLGLILVARSASNRFQVCTYLVDYWCLGVKDVLGPRQMDRIKYDNFIFNTYQRYSEGYEEITLQQAQDIVLGAVEYAEKLDLKPHPDFAQAKEHLGEWSGKTDLEFGRQGKPFFIAGPYDNASKIIRTLTQTVGEGNFEFVTPLGF